jgi:hypothetical protein
MVFMIHGEKREGWKKGGAGVFGEGSPINRRKLEDRISRRRRGAGQIRGVYVMLNAFVELITLGTEAWILRRPLGSFDAFYRTIYHAHIH